MPLRKRLENEMDAVENTILRMGAVTEEALHKAIQALKTRDHELARSVVKDDAHIDSLQLNIDQQIARTIAIEQPVANDLRRLLSYMKQAAEMERIGDHARHIASASLRISETGAEHILPLLQQMCQVGTEMLHSALNAFMERDASQAEKIAARDDEVDSLHAQAYREIVANMEKDSRRIQDGTNLIMISRYFERAADHVTNMCEWIVYSRRGEHVELNS